MFIKVLKPNYPVNKTNFNKLLIISSFSLISLGLYLILSQSLTQKFNSSVIKKSLIDSNNFNNNYCISDVQYHERIICIIK